MKSRQPDTGMVTAETAVIAPFGVVFSLLLAWIVSLGYTQVQLIDAAREGARAAAQGNTIATVAAQVKRAAPSGSTVKVQKESAAVRVSVSLTKSFPLLAGALTHKLTADSISALEE